MQNRRRAGLVNLGDEAVSFLSMAHRYMCICYTLLCILWKIFVPVLANISTLEWDIVKTVLLFTVQCSLPSQQFRSNFKSQHITKVWMEFEHIPQNHKLISSPSWKKGCFCFFCTSVKWLELCVVKRRFRAIYGVFSVPFPIVTHCLGAYRIRTGQTKFWRM